MQKSIYYKSGELFKRWHTVSHFHTKKESEHTQLVSFDIVSLYSNIQHDLGLKAISFWLDKYPELIANR